MYWSYGYPKANEVTLEDMGEIGTKTKQEVLILGT